MFGLYWFLLRKEKLFVFNRFFLLAAVVFSLIVPFVSIQVHFNVTPRVIETLPVYNNITQIAPEVSKISYLDGSSDQPVTKSSSLKSPFTLPFVLIAFYIIGVMLFLFRFSRNIYKITHKSRQSDIDNYRGYRVVLTDDKTGPYCFFRNIFLNKDDYKNGKIDPNLLDHELVHVRQLHSIDIILIEIVKILYWFNPIYVLYERAIRINHEYLADNGVIAKEPDVDRYMGILINFVSTLRNIPLTSGSLLSYTKNRIVMIQRIKSNIRINAVRITAVLSLGTFLLLILSFKESHREATAKNQERIVRLDNKVVRGVVTSDDGAPLKKVFVSSTGNKRTINATMTDSIGHFVLSGVNDNASLVFMHSGYKDLVIKPDFNSDMKVRMIKGTENEGRKTSSDIKVAKFRNSDFSPTKTLIVIDGKILSSNKILKLNPNEIKTINIVDGGDAIKKYGQKATNGAVEVVLYNSADDNKIEADTLRYETDYLINHSMNKGELINLPVSNIYSVTKYSYENMYHLIKGHKSYILMTRDYYKVKGKVVDDLGNPLNGVVVSNMDDQVKVNSDKEGGFLIKDVREGAILRFFLPGYDDYYLSTSFEVPFNLEQTIELIKRNTSKNNEYQLVDQMPQYPGGETELLKFLSMNIVYPEAAMKAKIQGKVIARFIVTDKGTIEKAEIIKSLSPEIDAEALRVVKMIQGFTPGSVKGKPVNVYYSVPLTFAIK
jgi:TonB family protein